MAKCIACENLFVKAEDEFCEECKEFMELLEFEQCMFEDEFDNMTYRM